MRNLCKRHLELFEELGLKMDIEKIRSEQAPACRFPGCTGNAEYRIQIIMEGAIIEH